MCYFHVFSQNPSAKSVILPRHISAKSCPGNYPEEDQEYPAGLRGSTAASQMKFHLGQQGKQNEWMESCLRGSKSTGPGNSRRLEAWELTPAQRSIVLGLLASPPQLPFPHL